VAAYRVRGTPSRETVQWGPVFFMVMDPCFAGAGFNRRSRAGCMPPDHLPRTRVLVDVRDAEASRAASDRDKWPLIVAGLAVVWLNFSPLLMVLPSRRRDVGSPGCSRSHSTRRARVAVGAVGFAVAAAGLIKALPLVIFYYLLIKNRRAFAYGCLAIGLFSWRASRCMGPTKDRVLTASRTLVHRQFISAQLAREPEPQGAILKLFVISNCPRRQIPHNGPVGYVVRRRRSSCGPQR